MVRQPEAGITLFLTTGLLKNVPKRSMPLEATVPTANGRIDERYRLFT